MNSHKKNIKKKINKKHKNKSIRFLPKFAKINRRKNIQIYSIIRSCKVHVFASLEMKTLCNSPKESVPWYMKITNKQIYLQSQFNDINNKLFMENSLENCYMYKQVLLYILIWLDSFLLLSQQTGTGHYSPIMPSFQFNWL